MNRLLLIIIAAMLLSGCAELRVIGSAAMNELSAEAIRVDNANDQPRRVELAQVAQEPQPKKTLVARANLNPFLKQPPKYEKIASRQRGLWEGR